MRHPIVAAALAAALVAGCSDAREAQSPAPTQASAPADAPERPASFRSSEPPATNPVEPPGVSSAQPPGVSSAQPPAASSVEPPAASAAEPQASSVEALPKLPVAASLPPLPAVPFAPQRPMDTVRAVYHFAALHPDVLRYVPCFCGCERHGHRDNEDCFIASRAADGRVSWDAHGIG